MRNSYIILKTHFHISEISIKLFIGTHTDTSPVRIVEYLHFQESIQNFGSYYARKTTEHSSSSLHEVGSFGELAKCKFVQI